MELPNYIINPSLRTIVISASRYTTIQSCFYATNLRYNVRLYPVIKNEYFERGSLIDVLCNVYYRGRKKGLSFNESLNDALENGRAFSVKTSLDVAKSEFIIERFVQYLHHNLNDDWQVIEVQAPFTKIIYQDESLQIIAEGLIDLLINTRAGFFVVDTKSTSREADKRKIDAQKLDNQFKLYCIVFAVNQVMINDIGVQKSKNEDALFKRRLINFPDTILLEWINNVVYWCNSWLDHDENKLYPQNFSSCYGCDYTSICAEESSMRQFIANRDFKIVEKDFNIYKKEE